MILTSVFIVAGYCASSLLIFLHLANTNSARWVQLTPALIAVLLQALLLRQQIYTSPGTMNLGFFIAFSLISWLVSVQILISCAYRPLHSLGIVMFPISALATLLSVFIPAGQSSGISADPSLQLHIMLSVIAYSLIMLSALQAIALAFQEHAIRSHHPGGLVRFLPPLFDMENLLFQMIGFGFIFLTTALFSGVFFIEDLFAQHLVHKTVLSIAGWVILAILLFGRFKFGWRGRVAIYWTLAAFTTIMLAYFGSKLVIEYLLPTTA